VLEFGLKYTNADTAKVDVLRHLEKIYSTKVPLAWIPPKLKAKFLGRDAAVDLENERPTKKTKAVSFVRDDAPPEAVTCPTISNAPRPTLATLDVNAAAI